MKKVLLIGLLSISLNVMAGVPLLDLIVKGSAELLEGAGKRGLKQAQSDSIIRAFGSLTKKSGIFIKRDITMALDSIKPSGEYLGDIEKIKRIRATLAKSTDDLSEKELQTFLNDTTVIAARYGDKKVVTCAGNCGEGAEALLSEASSLIKKYTEKMSSNPTVIKDQIVKMSKNLKVGDFSKATTAEALQQEDEVLVHVLLSMASSTNKEEKAFAKSLLDLSKHGNGPTNLFDTEFPNRLYRVLTDKNLESKLSQYTDFFKRVDAHVSEPMSAREKLVKYMEDIVSKMDDSNPEKAKLKEAFDDFNSANCFK
jgi:hypothetical protein